METSSNTKSFVPKTIDVKGLNKIYDDWHVAFVSRFEGVPVRIDESLEGGQYYIAVSRELYKEMKVDASLSVPSQALESPVEAR